MKNFFCNLFGIKQTFGLADAKIVVKELTGKAGVDAQTAMAAVSATLKIVGVTNVVAAEAAEATRANNASIAESKGNIKSYEAMIAAANRAIDRTADEQGEIDAAVAFVTGNKSAKLSAVA